MNFLFLVEKTSKNECFLVMWFNYAFLSYDENKNLVYVNVNVKDNFDIGMFGYAFQDVDIPWLKNKPTSHKSRVQKPFTKKISSSSSNTTTNFPLVLDSAKDLKIGSLLKLWL